MNTRLNTVAGRCIVLCCAVALLAACGKETKPAAPKLSADQLAVQTTIRKIIAAENAKDAETYLALVSDKALREFEVGTREEIKSGKSEDFGREPFELIRFAETIVTGDTASATVHAAPKEFKVARPLFAGKIALIRKSGTWLADGFEFLGGAPPAAGVRVIDVKVQEYAFIFAEERLPRKVAFKVTQAGKEDHEMALFRGPDGVDIATAKKALENVDGEDLKNIPSGYEGTHVGFFERKSGTTDVSFASALAAGTYVFACYIPQGGFDEQGPVNPKGKPHIKLGMIAVATVA